MKYFLGMVPPLVTKERVEEVQRSCASNKVPYFMEPHITLKNSRGLTEDKVWLAKVMTMLSSYPRFDIKLEEIGNFDTQTLFLSPIYSQELVDLHGQLVALLNPDTSTHEQTFEGAYYHPHLTLGETTWGGMSVEDLAVMRNKAELELWGIPSFQVSSVRLYQIDNPDEPYQKLIDIPLQF